MKRTGLLILALVGAGAYGADFFDLPLEELLEVPVSVASQTKTTARNSPAAVTVITAEEIHLLGARTLLDVLELVPGFHLGSDVSGVISLGVRGNWAQDGKILLLIDGIAVTESLFGTLQLGNRYPLESIARIEIVRGPGSAIYGGSAELAVIHIHTKAVEGVLVSGTLGQMNRGYARRNLELAFGDSVDDWKVHGVVQFGRGQASDRDAVDSAGTVYPFLDNSNQNSFFVNLGVTKGALELRFLADEFNTTDRSGYGVETGAAAQVDFATYAASAKYRLVVDDKLTITPELVSRRQLPFKSIDAGFPGLYYDVTTERHAARVTSDWEMSEGLRLISGAEFYYDFARNHVATFSSGLATIDYENLALFSELLADFPWFTISLGARYENHSAYGSSFVPRLSLIRQGKDYHLKLLYSRGFRAPVIENINLNPGIQAERIGVAEIEAGYALSDNLHVTANLFDIRMTNPIVYAFVAGTDFFLNSDRSGTHGFELQARWKDTWGHAGASYSYYRANETTVPNYFVTMNPTQHLGFPAHKFGFNGALKLTDDLSLGGSVVVLGQRYGITSAETEIPTTVLGSLFLNRENFLTPNLSLGVGVFNLFDSNYFYIQPYTGGSAPIPATSRELMLRATYQVGF